MDFTNFNANLLFSNEIEGTSGWNKNLQNYCVILANYKA
jgi:hypothetical protein